MRRGQPLAFWGLMLGLAGAWTAARWPGLAARHQLLAAALASPGQLPPHAAVMLAAAGPAPAANRRPILPPSAAPFPQRRLIRLAAAPANRQHPPLLALPAAPPPALPPAPLAEQALAASPPLPEPAAPPASPAPAFHLAEAAYDRLAAGQRRQAAALFDAAIAIEPGNRQWQQDRAALRRRWQLGGFSLLRDGAGGGPAASPVLGGGQMGASIAFLPDPLARRPLALVARANAAAGHDAVAVETAQAAIGLRQTLRPGITLSAERLIALGAATRGDWTLRLAAGGETGRFSGYGEAGVLGNGQIYGGAQAGARLLRLGPATLAAGSWASLQSGVPDVWRVDVGPSMAAQWRGLRFQADWRQRVAGNALPGSGPVVTLSTGF
jgi:hypothetical protein